MQVKVLKKRECKNIINGCKLGCEDTCLKIIKPRALTEALGNKISLITFDRAIHIMLYLKTQ